MRPVSALECAGWLSLLLMLVLASPGVRVEAAGAAPVAAVSAHP